MHPAGRTENLEKVNQIEGDATNKINHKSAPECTESAVSYCQKSMRLTSNDPLKLRPIPNQRSENRIEYQSESQSLATRELVCETRSWKRGIANTSNLNADKLNMPQQTMLGQTTRSSPRQAPVYVAFCKNKLTSMPGQIELANHDNHRQSSEIVDQMASLQSIHQPLTPAKSACSAKAGR